MTRIHQAPSIHTNYLSYSAQLVDFFVILQNKISSFIQLVICLGVNDFAYRRCPCKPSYVRKTKFYRRDKKRSYARCAQFYV